MTLQATLEEKPKKSVKYILMNGFHRFTIKAQEAMQNAQDLAGRYNHGSSRRFIFWPA